MKMEESTIYVEMPIKTVSVANLREHWAVRAKRAKVQRLEAYICCKNVMPFVPCAPDTPITIKLTRIGKRRMDGDNLSGSQKNVRDGIADWLKIDDGDARLTWLYEQIVDAKKANTVIAEITFKP